jgi:hypothetical protein
MKAKFYINNAEFNSLYFADDQAIIVNSEDYLKTPYIYIYIYIYKLGIVASITTWEYSRIERNVFLQREKPYNN